MNTEKFVHYLSDYIDGELDSALQAEFEETIRNNSDHRMAYNTFYNLVQLCRNLGDMEIPQHHRLNIPEIIADL